MKQDRQRTYNVTQKRVRVTIVAVKRNEYYILRECVSVVLVIQHAKLMRRVILSSVASLAPQHFPTLSHKRHDFRGGGGEVIKNKMCFDLPRNF
jgi:hypothetical protein